VSRAEFRAIERVVQTLAGLSRPFPASGPILPLQLQPVAPLSGISRFRNKTSPAFSVAILERNTYGSKSSSVVVTLCICDVCMCVRDSYTTASLSLPISFDIARSDLIKRKEKCNPECTRRNGGSRTLLRFTLSYTCFRLRCIVFFT